MSKRQSFTFGLDDNPSASVNQYLSITGNGEVSAWTSTENETKIVIGADGVLTNLQLNANSAPGASKSIQVAVRVNGSTSSFSVTLSGASATKGRSLFKLDVVAGDVVDLIHIPTGSPTVSFVWGSLEFMPTVENQTLLVGSSADANLPLSGRYLCPHAPANPSATYADVYMLTVEKNGGTFAYLTKLYVQLETAPGGAASRTFTIYKNGATTGVSLTITGASTTGNLSNSIAMDDGDTFALYATATGGPATSKVYYGFVYEPEILGEYMISGVTNSLLPTGAGVYNYNRMSTGNSTWSATKTDRNVMAGEWNHYVRCLGVKLSRAPDTLDPASSNKSYEFYLEHPSAVTIVANVVDNATYGKSSEFAFGAKAFNTWNIRSLAYNTPASASATWTTVMRYLE